MNIKTTIAVLSVLLLAAAPVLARQAAISGTVTDVRTGETLPGATVMIETLQRGASTDLQGRYNLTNIPAGVHTLRVTYMGYKNQTRVVDATSGTAVADFALEEDFLGLDEVVVVGYGTEQRANVSGSVGSLRMESIESVPLPTVENALQGRIAGVRVTQNSGAPGSAISIRVRGSSSISAGNDPLYVIDGVPVNQGNFSQINATFGGQGINTLSDLNPDDVESIEVLKDASAAAIYGSRASNGVVLITTKRGREGAPRIDFSAYYGTQNDYNRVKYLNAQQYMEVYNESILNAFGLPDYFGYEDDGTPNFVEVPAGTDTDWLDEVLRAAPIANTSISVSGGTDRTRYFVSGTSFIQDGIVRGFGYERLNGRVNLDYQAFNNLTLGTNISLTRGVIERSRSDNTIYGPFANANAVPPIEPVYNEDGSYFNTLYANPVGLGRENEAEERTLRILGNTFASYRLADGLELRGSLGLDQYTLRSRLYDSPIVGVATGTGGSGTSANSFVTKITYESTLSFNRTYRDLHSVTGVVGGSYEDNVTETSSVSGSQFPNEFFKYLTSAATISSGSSAYTEWTLASLFSRVNYTYNDRYTLTVNVRTDGSSRFGEDNRYGFFPSASALWRIIDEPFMSRQEFLSDLRLRTSYGVTGNQFGIGNFASRGLWAGGSNYDDQPGIAPAQLANPDLKWETTRQFNIGADFAIFNQRLAFTLDYFIKKTDDLLLNRPVPRSTGFTSLTSNVGSMENRGFEVSVRAHILRGSLTDLRWTSELNIGTTRNEVTRLYQDEPINTGFASRIEVGQPLGVFYGFVTDGLFRTPEEVNNHAFQDQDTSPGDIRFRDLNGDGFISGLDRQIIGDPWPDFSGGFNNSFQYRGFDLSVFLEFVYGNDIFNANRLYTDAYGTFFDNHTTRALDRWTPDNPDASEPRAVWGDPNFNTRNSDRFIEDGSYLRIKNLILGYNLPGETITRFGFRSARIYLQAQNLHTFTNYSGFDPEVNYAGNTGVVRGTDFYTLPQARTLTAGINLGF